MFLSVKILFCLFSTQFAVVNANFDDQFKNIIVLHKNDFDAKVTATGDPYFVQFFAPWCGHCMRMMPTWDETAVELKGKVHIARVDCTIDPELKDKFRIRGFPTLKLFFDGRVVEFHGARSKPAFVQFLESHNAYLGVKREQKFYTLHTHTWRASGEPVRLLLAETGEKYTHKQYTEVQWDTTKPQLQEKGVAVYGELPILTVGQNEELAISGTSAIIRYLNTVGKLGGDTADQQSTADIILYACDDFMRAYNKAVMVHRDSYTENTILALTTTYIAFFTNALNRARKLWNSDGYGGFVTGSSLSGIDLYMFDIVTMMLGASPRFLDRNPAIRDWFVSIGTRDNINEYLMSEKRLPYLNSPRAAFGNAQYPDDPGNNPFRSH